MLAAVSKIDALERPGSALKISEAKETASLTETARHTDKNRASLPWSRGWHDIAHFEQHGAKTLSTVGVKPAPKTCKSSGTSFSSIFHIEIFADALLVLHLQGLSPGSAGR